MRFSRKSYGAIFTDKEENIEKIRQIIKELDEFEFEYLPSEMVKVFEPRIVSGEVDTYASLDLCYTHKFDSLELNSLVLICWSRGIHAWYIEGDYNKESLFVTLPKGTENDA